jgi:SAM-dependent methyltransferase
VHRLEHDTLTPDVETASDGYARRFAGPVGTYFLAQQAAAAARLLSDSDAAGRRALDVGGGHGQLTPLLLQLGFDVWVQGSAPSCQRRLLNLMHEHRGRMHFVTSSLWALPFADRSFDLVLGIRLLAHVERWQALLSEMARVCRYQLLVEYPPIGSVNLFDRLLFPLKRKIETDTRPYFSYSSRQLLAALREFGFERFSAEKQFFLPMVIHRALKRPSLSRQLEACTRWLGLTQMLGAPVILVAERASGVPTRRAA